MTTPVELVITGRNESEAALDSAANGISRIGQIAAGILTSQVFTKIAQGVVNFGKDILNSAMESQDVLADLNATIQSTGGVAGVTADMATSLANSLQKVTRFGDETIVSAESMLLTFTKIGKDVFPQATEAALNMAQKFKTDPTQAAIQLGKALNDPIEGVGALRRVGVALTNEQEEQIKKFMQLGDVASAQKVILGELETEFGGLARAAGETFAGRMDILKNRIDEVKEGIGLALIPIIERLMDKFMPLLPVIEKAAQDFANFLTQANTTSNGIKEFVSGALEYFSKWWSENGPGISASAEQIFGGIKQLSKEIGASIGPLVSDILEKFKTWFTENGPLIQATIQRIADIFTTYLVPIILVVWQTIQPILKGIIDLVLGLAKIVMQVFTGDWAGAWETAKTTASAVFEALIQAAMNLISGLLAVFGTSVPEIAANIQSGFEKAKDVVINTFENLKLSISTKFIEIKTTVTTKINDVINAIKSKISQFQQLGNSIVTAIKTGISNAWTSFVDWIIGMVQNIIDDLIAAATGGGGSTSGSGASSQNVANHNATAQSLAQRVTNNRSNTLYNFGTISYAGGAMGSNPLDIFG